MQTELCSCSRIAYGEATSSWIKGKLQLLLAAWLCQQRLWCTWGIFSRYVNNKMHSRVPLLSASENNNFQLRRRQCLSFQKTVVSSSLLLYFYFVFNAHVPTPQRIIENWLFQSQLEYLSTYLLPPHHLLQHSHHHPLHPIQKLGDIFTIAVYRSLASTMIPSRNAGIPCTFPTKASVSLRVSFLCFSPLFTALSQLKVIDKLTLRQMPAALDFLWIRNQ